MQKLNHHHILNLITLSAISNWHLVHDQWDFRVLRTQRIAGQRCRIGIGGVGQLRTAVRI